MRQRANPEVKMALGTTAEFVRIARAAARGGGTEAIEEGHPDSSVTGTLIHQHCRGSRLAQQGDGGLKPLLAIESCHAFAPVPIDEFVQIGIAQRLVDRAETRLGTLEGSLCVKLPTAQMTDGENHPRPATIFLLTTSLFSNGAMRRMTSRGSAANLNEQIPLAPRVAKWRNVSQRISEEDFSLPKAAERFSLASLR